MAGLKELEKMIVPAFAEAKLKKLGVTDEQAKLFSNYKIFPIDILVKADWNYKKEDEFKSGKLRENLKRVGQIENIHVRKLDTGYYEVVNGNHRLDSLRELEVKFIMAYDHGSVSQAEAIRRAVETNETRFPTDSVLLAELINQMNDEFGSEDLLLTMPYTDDEWKEFEEMFNFDFEQYEGNPEFPDDPTVKVLRFEVPAEVAQKWEEWKQRVNKNLGYDSDWKAFEFAIVEALNIPEESLE